MSDDVALKLDSVKNDPEAGHFVGELSGKLCHIRLPVIEVDQSNCKRVTIGINSELTKLC
ncbi:MAG: hypothetical protein ACK5LJ_17875 [Paracoccus sp. (in: a-proteobacteria)]